MERDALNAHVLDVRLESRGERQVPVRRADHHFVGLGNLMGEVEDVIVVEFRARELGAERNLLLTERQQMRLLEIDLANARTPLLQPRQKLAAQLKRARPLATNASVYEQNHRLPFTEPFIPDRT